MKRSPVHFLILNQSETHEAVVTIAVVNVKGGDLAQSASNLQRQIEEAGMWCTQIHPVAARVLLQKCSKVAGVRRVRGLLKGPDVVRKLREEKT